MRVLLDTNLILWWQGMRDKVPAAARLTIEDEADEVLVSRASLWEIAIKKATGRLTVDLQRFCDMTKADGFEWLPIENSHILELADLPTFPDHKDPFDRLLVAQSLSEPLILLTIEAKLARYGSTIRVV